jgi:predicted TIM-barrel fold metal-dependent hydrolase
MPYFGSTSPSPDADLDRVSGDVQRSQSKCLLDSDPELSYCALPIRREQVPLEKEKELVVDSETPPDAAVEPGAQPKTLLIDTDVHEYYRSIKDLSPYLDPVWRGQSPNLMGGMSYPIFDSFARQEWILDDGTMGTDLDRMREHLFEDEGVSIGILNGFFHVSSFETGWEYATALASAYNDWQVEHWLEKEPRLRGSVHVVANDPVVAAREIDRVAAHPQIVQVFLPLATDREYGDPFYRPIYEAAVRNGLVVTLHHGARTKTVLGYPRYHFEWHCLAAPQACTNQLLSFIANGTFEALPELRIVFLETGVAWLPWFMWRADQQYKELRHEIPWVKRLPSEHIRDNVRVSTQPMSDISPQQFLKLVEMADSDRVHLFATDYPHYDADSPSIALPGVLPADLRDRLRFKNALETFPRLAGLA